MVQRSNDRMGNVMEMHQIRYFLAAARLLNFTRAAEACNVAQPSLTRAIQKLEEELGGALFRRERARTHLTELGRLMLPHLERTYRAAEDAKALAKGFGKGQVAPLVLGVCSLVESATLDAVLAELADAMPGLQLNVVGGTSADLLAQALAGQLDLMIIEAPADAPERFEAWRLFSHDYRMVVRRDHPAANQPAVSLADLAREPLVDHGCEGMAALRRQAEVVGITLNLRHAARDVGQLKRLIAAGLGTGFMPDPRDLAMCAVPVAGTAISADVVLAGIQGRRRSLAAESFLRASRARNWANGSA
ncbi:LysR family transcriptional regulator [Sandarakinorhabdus cyanobacteriorum]|uniref:LysR family transcriptional regulator n=1 Tax=Sandarakinorhabdus cyanobacteriorum TaxID=1981098 RepID=UPI0013FD5135|nr:LysR family transcriptional regulator [Sandarakinorhabdus cyanobacteriorum]